MAFTDLPLKRSAPLGVGAYVLGYLLAVAVTGGRVDEVMRIEIAGEYADPAPLAQILGSQSPSWVVNGWLFYNAHFVPTSLPTADAVNGMAHLTNRNLLSSLGGPLLALYLLPPLLLLGSGYLVVRSGSTFGANGVRNAGASVAVGYVPAFVLGAFVFDASAATASVTATPAGLSTIFFGFGYPVAFGAVGGMLAERRSDPASDAPDGKVETR
ncbi:hypothetical protein [Halomicrococcus gelatinilyticus]|uniref:hypothetical protein n=1 Tax=Halomicrococcus gelatinilyticus TaxID=1702103 RepID=UPI002E0DBD51